MIEETFNFGCKRIYTLKGENNLFQRDENGNLMPGDNTYIDGEFKEFDREGNLRYQVTYINGKKQGKEIGWYPDGKIHWEVDYVDDNRQGELNVYYGERKWSYLYLEPVQVGR